MVYRLNRKSHPGASNAGGQTIIIEREPKKKNRFLSWLGRFFMLLGVMAFLSSISTFVMIANLGSTGDDDPASIANGAILTYHFKGGLSDVAPDATLSDPFAALSPSMHDVAYALRNAAKDDNVKAFVARISSGAYSFSEVLEVSEAIAEFRASGKKAYVYSTAYGDFGNGTMEYMLALSFDEIWMQPMGQVTLSGFQAEVPYFKETLGKLGINAQIYQRKDFKTAPESITKDSMTPENKKSLQDILATFDQVFLDTVRASGRGIEVDGHLMSKYRGAPIADTEALEHNYIDRLGYIDELIEALEKEYNLNIKAYRNLLGYDFDITQQVTAALSSNDDMREGAANVALIFIDGAIMDTDPASAQSAPLVAIGGPVAGALQISATIKKAAEKEDIDMIVLRVNSPGGSPSASETIRRAVIYAQEKGKKVFLSMGAAAASGGYWVSANADYIMAYPTTITGSIGVFGGKMNLKGFWNKIGVNWAQVSAPDADISTLWSQNMAYDPQAKKIVNTMLDRIYDNFVTLVAQGRGLSYDEAESLARGRVWMGVQAHENGLVDGLGTLEDLMVKAAEELSVHRDNLRIRIMPEPVSPLQSIINMLKGGPKIKAQSAGIDTLYGASPSYSSFKLPSLMRVDDLNGVVQGLTAPYTQHISQPFIISAE